MTAAYVKLPKRIWIGTYEFALKVVEVGAEVLRAESDDPEELPAEGLTDTEIRVIYVVEMLELRRLLEVVWHEIQHAINWVNDLEHSMGKLKGENQISDIEEHIAELSGKSWTQLFLDNPRLQMWITRVANQIRKERASA